MGSENGIFLFIKKHYFFGGLKSKQSTFLGKLILHSSDDKLLYPEFFGLGPDNTV